MKRASTTQTANKNVFCEEIDRIFDIAHADAMSLITIEEDRLFLINQRGERKGYMAGVDMALAKTEERVQKRK